MSDVTSLIWRKDKELRNYIGQSGQTLAGAARMLPPVQVHIAKPHFGSGSSNRAQQRQMRCPERLRATPLLPPLMRPRPVAEEGQAADHTPPTKKTKYKSHRTPALAPTTSTSRPSLVGESVDVVTESARFSATMRLSRPEFLYLQQKHHHHVSGAWPDHSVTAKPAGDVEVGLSLMVDPVARSRAASDCQGRRHTKKHRQGGSSPD
jgi:hypothetical protein